MQIERLGIVGPGAMGLFHAVYLARAGLSVTLLDYWPERAARLREGLVLERQTASGEQERWTVRVPCQALPYKDEPYDLLIFTVKAYATETAASLVKPLTGPHTVLLSLQNGLGNAEVLGRYQAWDYVLVGVTTSGATRLNETTVLERGVGVITLGSPAGNFALAEAVAAHLQRALPAEAAEDIWPVIWRKLAINCAINPLTALLNLPNGALLETPVRPFLGAIAQEVGRVAQALGIALEAETLPAAVEDVCHLTAQNISSMLQDVRARRKTEIAALNGAVARLAHEHGLQAPLNALLAALIESYTEYRPLE